MSRYRPLPKPPTQPAPPGPRPRARPTAPARPRRRKKPRGGWLRRWRDRAPRAWRLVTALPPVVRVTLVLAVVAAGAAAANAIHWTLRKPTELLAPVSGALMKTPSETWSAYGDLFRLYSTPSVTPELLAALAQTESAGNWAARTYWRWNFKAGDLFGFYRPASSSVGMFQMTDAAFSDAKRHCIRNHAVIAARSGAPDCGYDEPLARVVPEHAIELTAVWLERSVAQVLDGRPATARQRHDLAAIIHLCGARPARTFARRGFRLAAGDTCGDHDSAAYLAQVQTLERQFRQLAER